MRSLYHDPVSGTNKYRLQIEQGGTSADNHADAITNLGGLQVALINKPGGVVGLDSNGFIDPTLIPSGLAFGVPLNIKGLKVLEQGESTILQITNYDSFTDYVVEFNGVTGYRSEDLIYVTALTRGSGSVVVNGSHFPVNTTGNIPLESSISGGVLINTISSSSLAGSGGTHVESLIGGSVATGYPTVALQSSNNVGLIEITDVGGQVVRQIKADSGRLTFETTMSTGGSVSVTSDSPGSQGTNATSSGPIEVPAGSSVIQVVGKGGDGSTVWVPQVVGVSKMTANGVVLPSTFSLRFGAHDNYAQGSTLVERKVRIQVDGRTNTDLIIDNLSKDMSDQLGDGAIVNRSATISMRVEMFKTTITIVSNTSPSTEYVYIDILQPDNTTVRVNGSFVGNGTDSRTSIYEFTDLRFIRDGAVAGYYSQRPGSATTFQGHSKSLTWTAGTGSPLGTPVPFIDTTSIVGTYRLQVELKYDSHPRATGPATLSTPFVASTNQLLKPITIGDGIDTIERELQYSLLDTLQGSTQLTSIGSVRVEFVNGKVRLTMSFGSTDIWKDNPVSSKLVLVKTVSGSEVRTEFPMIYIGNVQGRIFEVSNYQTKPDGVTTRVGTQAAENSTKTIKTIENNRFGEMFSTSADIDTIAVGIITEALTDKSQVAVIEKYNTDSVRSYLGEPNDSIVFGALRKVKLSGDAQHLLVSYPDADQSGRVAFYSKSSIGYSLFTVKNLGGLETGALFGYSMDCNYRATNAVVGAPGKNIVVVYATSVLVIETHRINSPAGFTDFGREVRINDAGDKIAVGAVNLLGKGVVMIFNLEDNGWSLSATINQPDNLPKEINFGKTFDLDSDFNLISISAPGSSSLIGRNFLFFNGTRSWEHYKTLGESSSSVGDGFGSSVSIDDDGKYVAIGAPNDATVSSHLGKTYQYAGNFSFL